MKLVKQSNFATRNRGDFTVTQSGEAFMSHRKLAEMLGVSLDKIKRQTEKIDTSRGVPADAVVGIAIHFDKAGVTKAHEFLAMLMQTGIESEMTAERL